MKENGKNKGRFNIIIGAVLLAAVFCVMQQGITGISRGKSEAETVIIEEVSMDAPVNETQSESISQKEVILEEEREDIQTAEAGSGDEWVMPNITLVYGDDRSTEKRPEEMTKEEAAAIGVQYLESCFGLDCEGKEVYLSLVESEVEPLYPRQYWGEVVGEGMEGFRFSVDAVSGKLVSLRQRIRASQRATGLDDDAYEKAHKEYKAAIDKNQKEAWISTEEFMEMTNPVTWSKIAKSLIRENGLNDGKMINSAPLVGYSSGCAIVECFYNELKDDKERVEVAIDIRTKELIYYNNR